MSVYAKALLLLLLAALCACRVDVGHHDGEAASQAAAAAPVLQSVEVGKTTLEQALTLYPDLQQFNNGFISFGNRILTSDSGMIEVYGREILNKSPQQILIFDSDSKVLQMVVLSRVDKDVTPFVRELEIIGFTSYPQLTEQEFAILNSGVFVTAEERQKVLGALGVQQFKRGDVFAMIVPAREDNGTALLVVTNLAYEPEHRAKWQRQEAAKQQAGQQ